MPLDSPRQLSFFPSFPEGCHPDLVMFLTFSIVRERLVFGAVYSYRTALELSMRDNLSG